MEQNKENIQESVSWTPEIIVDLIGEVAWPIVILLIAWRFKDSIKSGIISFFNRNNVTEFSVGASGFTAKMEASKQEAESIKTKKTIELLPEGQDADSIKLLHIERATKYSLELLQKTKDHVAALDLLDQEKIELLCSEISIMQSMLQYMNITTVLFLSQYNLFNKSFYPHNIVSKEDIEAYFNGVMAHDPEGHKGWDVDQYLAYPLSIKIIEQHENGYRLTNLGSSYVNYIRSNPIYLDYLANL